MSVKVDVLPQRQGHLGMKLVAICDTLEEPLNELVEEFTVSFPQMWISV